MNMPVTNHDLQEDQKIVPSSEAVAAKKPVANKQQMKAAYLMVLVALMDSLKTSNQTAQVQAKEQSQAISAQQQLINQMQAIKGVEFSHGQAFEKDHYWKVVYYTLSGWNNHHWHTIYTHGPVTQSWLEHHGGSHYVGPRFKQHELARYVWITKKATPGELQKLQIDMEKTNESRTIIEGKVNLGQQKSQLAGAALNMTVQGLQELISQIANVSQQLGAFSNRIASI